MLRFDNLKEFWHGLEIYISNKFKKARGDWNQNNPEADNYIKNRPFYSDNKITETIIFPSTDITCEYTDDVGIYMMSENAPQLIVDIDYRIIFDGAEYNCRCVAIEGIPVLGNIGMLNGSLNTKEPFFIANDGNTFGIITQDTETTTHNISITEIRTQTTIKKIDNQYLPAMDYVSYVETQDLTDEQKAKARENIDAGTSNFSGRYNDLINKPTLAEVATSGSYNDLINKPALANVATSGSYNDLIDKPETIDNKILILEDIANNIKYNLYIENGELTISPVVVAIRVASYPSKLSYTNFDDFDISGTLIELVYPDGTSKITEDYEYSLELNEDNINSRLVVITYSDMFVTLNTSFEIYLSSLEDFTYGINEDGNYILTGWKGTHLGVENNECILPSGQNIML